MQGLTLLRENFSLRRLWFSQLISSIGDWFNYVAVISMVMALTGSGLQIALAIICRTIPVLLLGPWIGVWVDRLPKKQVMVATDLLRMAMALGYLLVHKPEDLWIIYAISACLSVCTVLFEAGRSAYVSQAVDKANLLTANGIYSLTFGLTIAIGSLAGGWIISLLGNGTAFLFNAATFFWSAIFLSGIQDEPPLEYLQQANTSRHELWSTWQWLNNNRLIVLILLADASLAIGSGVMSVLLGIYALRIFAAGSFGLGLLYNALGLGFVLGSLTMGKMKPHMLSAGFIFSSWMLVGIGCSWSLFSRSSSLFVAACLLVLAYFFQAVFGVLYNTMLMLFIPADMQGKVFALDRVKLVTVMSLATLLTGWLLQFMAPRSIGLGIGLFILGSGIVWIGIFRHAQAIAGEREKQDASLST